MQRRTKIIPRERASTRWPNIFTTKRNVKDPRFLQARDVLMEVPKDIVDASFEDFESSTPSWDIAVVRRFFRDAGQKLLTSRNPSRARLDDRDCETKNSRSYLDWLDATELERVLSAEVCLRTY